MLSDRIGVRTVAVFGYCIVGISLIGLVQSENVYPELLVGRLGFSLGGAACSTVSATGRRVLNLRESLISLPITFSRWSLRSCQLW